MASAMATHRFAEPDALVVLVGAELTLAGGADTAAVATTAQMIARSLRRGQLVVFSGASPPGTTRTVVLPVLVSTGLTPGRDFFLAYSRESTGVGSRRVVGGFDDASARAVANLFTRAGFDVTCVSSLEAAELCGAVGAVESTIRAAAANELRLACARMGVDAWEILGAVGAGHAPESVARDPAPLLLAWGARRWGGSFRFIELASAINAAIPAYVITKLAAALNDAGKAVRGSKVAILGMANRRDAADLRESPSFELMDQLLKKGAQVSYNDPHIPSLPRMRHWPELEPMHSQILSAEYLSAQDCVLIATDHTAYDYSLIVRHSKLVIDTRNATKAVTDGREKIVRV
jgi:UDP-N-acetyl-D-glucosamine dehydrogenase